MSDLIAPHGGLKEPVCCTVAAGEVEAFKAAAAKLPKVPVSDADLSTVYRFGDGALSPLTGPMDKATFDRVLDESVIEHDGKLYAWTIPLSLPVTKELAATLKKGQTVALTNSAGEVVATLDVNDVFEWDKPRYLKSVYLTERTDHPGADMVLKGDADKTHLIGGKIRVLPQPKNPTFGKYVLSPREVRKLLADKGWNRVVAFQTRNPLHRAHEYALVYGLEALLKAGHNAGAVLNPLIGETKGDDVNADVRMQTYEALIDTRALGEGDSDASLWGPRKESVPDRVILLGLRHQDVLRRSEGSDHARHLSPELRLHRHRHRPQARRRAVRRRHGDLGRLRRAGNLREPARRPEDPAGQGRLRRLLRLARPRRPDGKPQGREAGVHLRQGRPQDAARRHGVDPRIMRESTSKILSSAMAG